MVPQVASHVVRHILDAKAVRAFYAETDAHKEALDLMFTAATSNRLHSAVASIAAALPNIVEELAKTKRAAEDAAEAAPETDAEAERQEAIAAIARVREQLAVNGEHRTDEMATGARACGRMRGDPVASPSSPGHAVDLPCRPFAQQPSRLVRPGDMDIRAHFERVVKPAAVAEWMITVGQPLINNEGGASRSHWKRSLEGL